MKRTRTALGVVAGMNPVKQILPLVSIMLLMLAMLVPSAVSASTVENWNPDRQGTDSTEDCSGDDSLGADPGEAIIHWIFTSDDTSDEILTVVVNGVSTDYPIAKKGGSATHFITPFVDFDEIDNAYVTYNGDGGSNVGLRISHWCDGGKIEGKPLSISKTVDASFKRTWDWKITKKATPASQNIAAGGEATFDYEVSVEHGDKKDSHFALTGVISVENPNGFDVSDVDVTDKLDIDGAPCTVTGGSDATILAGKTKTFDYTCAVTDKSATVNTATVKWPDTETATHLLPAGSAKAVVNDFTFKVSKTDECIDVKDKLGSDPATVLGTVCVGDDNPKTFTYQHTFPGVAGTCTKYPNTASFKSQDSDEHGSADATVEVCVGADLKVKKDATPSFQRNYDWKIKKSVDPASQNIAEGGSATFDYTVEVSHGAAIDSDFKVKGTITVENPNDWEAISATVSDATLGGTCTVTAPATQIVPKSGSATFDYTCTFGSNPDKGTNTATATWDKAAASTPNGSADGTKDYDFTDPTTVADNCIDVKDKLGSDPATVLGTVCVGDDNPKTFTYQHTFPGVAGTCTKYPNTASFKSQDSDEHGSADATVEVCVGADLKVKKDATPSYDRAYTWNILKKVDKTTVSQAGGTATFNYTVIQSLTSHTDSGFAVKGTITVENPNDWQAIDATVSDSIDNGGNCTVDAPTTKTVPKSGSATFDYTCTFGSNPDAGTNTATATWDKTAASTPNGSANGTAAYDFTDPTTFTDECVKVTDSYAGTLDAELCVGEAPQSYTYSRTVPVPATGCVRYDNTATFTANDTSQTGSSSQTVTVCGETGARTIGFWQNKNGQGIITGGASVGTVCKSGTWLRQFAPFQDLSATATCAQVATYVFNVIKAASAAGTSMNPMLKAQMLATALDVYFSDPALGGNKINAPAPIGGISIDLTQICKNIGGGCTITENTSAAFGGATSKTVLELLTYAASQSNVGGTNWYGQVKAIQELAKDTFDAINNDKALGA